MNRNYDKPYRGLPTEIRLEIWKFTIPESGVIQGPRPVPWAWDLQLPKLQTQILRLNREVHNEVLSIFKTIKVKLLAEVDCEKHWTRLSQVLRSPILDKLEMVVLREYCWTSAMSRTFGVVLFKLLSMNSSHAMHTFIIDLDAVDRFYYNYYEHSESTHWLTDNEAIAAFAPALLKKSLVQEVRVNIGTIREGVLPLWTAENLKRYTTITPPSMHRVSLRASNYTNFCQKVREIAGPDCGRDIHIQSEFSSKGCSSGKSKGSVVFTLESE